MNRTWQVQARHLICSCSEVGQGRRCPPRCPGLGNLMVATTARTCFVATLTFALAACGGGGGGMGQGPPVISAFSASPTDAVTGHRITLSWTVAGATDLSISGVGEGAGSKT